MRDTVVILWKRPMARKRLPLPSGHHQASDTTGRGERVRLRRREEEGREKRRHRTAPL